MTKIGLYVFRPKQAMRCIVFNLFILIVLSTNHFSFTSETIKKKVSIKEAIAVYRCTCADEDWEQDATKVKLCAYCGPSMPQCGVLQKVVPKKGIKYSIHDYILPNKACPIDNKVTHKSILEKYRGKSIHFCSRKCKRTFVKSSLKSLKNLHIKPELVGLKLPKTKVKVSH